MGRKKYRTSCLILETNVYLFYNQCFSLRSCHTCERSPSKIWVSIIKLISHLLRNNIVFLRRQEIKNRAVYDLLTAVFAWVSVCVLFFFWLNTEEKMIAEFPLWKCLMIACKDFFFKEYLPVMIETQQRDQNSSQD